jgi:trehalose 6-phosphate synthase/phosphatase
MLGCDLIGFHVDEYVENFLASARVLLGARVSGSRIYWEGREIRVEAHPIGIDVQGFQEIAGRPSVDRRAKALREELGTEHLLIGIDRMDYTKGIPARLLAFEKFLKQNPDYHEKVTLFQVATPSRTSVESYQDLKREVDEIVGRINGAFSRSTWVPVRYHYRALPPEELCVLYRAADAALVTPMRDGMNLVALEYAATCEDGVLVLSELAGAAYLLPDALLVNPYDEDALVRAIKTALEMPHEERAARLGRLRRSLAVLDVNAWASGFLASLNEHAAISA